MIPRITVGIISFAIVAFATAQKLAALPPTVNILSESGNTVMIEGRSNPVRIIQKNGPLWITDTGEVIQPLNRGHDLPSKQSGGNDKLLNTLELIDTLDRMDARNHQRQLDAQQLDLEKQRIELESKRQKFESDQERRNIEQQEYENWRQQDLKMRAYYARVGVAAINPERKDADIQLGHWLSYTIGISPDDYYNIYDAKTKQISSVTKERMENGFNYGLQDFVYKKDNDGNLIIDRNATKILIEDRIDKNQSDVLDILKPSPEEMTAFNALVSNRGIDDLHVALDKIQRHRWAVQLFENAADLSVPNEDINVAMNTSRVVLKENPLVYIFDFRVASKILRPLIAKAKIERLDQPFIDWQQDIETKPNYKNKSRDTLVKLFQEYSEYTNDYFSRKIEKAQNPQEVDYWKDLFQKQKQLEQNKRESIYNMP